MSDNNYEELISTWPTLRVTAATDKLGETDTENIIANFCENIFTRLFVYVNPFKDDKTAKEFCDVLVVFGHHIIIFFDRRRELSSNKEDSTLEWKRWLKKTIVKQVNTSHGAENWLLNGNKIFTDKDLDKVISIPHDIQSLIIHRIIIAHGADDACLASSDSNIYGSLAIAYSDEEDPFEGKASYFVPLGRNKPIHIFDGANLHIMMDYLDTPTDFIDYLTAKEDYIKRHTILSYCGEEDLLGNYLTNIDRNNMHFIGRDDDHDGLALGQGLWDDIVKSRSYISTSYANRISCLWVRLIPHVSREEFPKHPSAMKDIYKLIAFEMLKEKMVKRRGNSERIAKGMLSCKKIKLSDGGRGFIRHCLHLQRPDSNVSYVVLMLTQMPQRYTMNEYVNLRTKILEIACVYAIDKYRNLDKIIGIAFDPITPFDPLPGIYYIMIHAKNITPNQIEINRRENQHYKVFGTGKEEKVVDEEFVD